ncbi:hypothetical protein EKG39_06395 [Shewanella atlantica]|uniref:Uncharacterized protein n=2 Tax=Shewanella atlantica TaxID=271099 RepID=A0A431WEG8_9GAMM|nr:hypothetical protein EKG39_06395 [Shewanella atlantica]
MVKDRVSGCIKLFVLATPCLLIGCAELNDFPMEQSYQQMKNMQILDPGAAERNDGIVGELEGNYGEKVMQAYRESSEAPKSARKNVSLKEI